MKDLKELMRILEIDRLLRWQYSAAESRGIAMLVTALLAAVLLGS